MAMTRIQSTGLAWIAALLLTSCAVWMVGENPLHVLKVLGASAFGSAENFSYTLFYATPMLLTGTAVTLALEAGLFNIGAEGQLYIGALCALLAGYYTHSIIVGFIFSFLGGAIWAAIAGFLKTKRNTHEVITTIMLNFIAMALVNWAVLNPLKNPETQSLETVWIGEAIRIPRMWNQATFGLPLALILAITVLWGIKRSWWGFRIRATGLNESAARVAGIRVNTMAVLAMAASGGIAALAGFHEVFFSSYRLVDAFSPGFGFTGLAIALLARGNIPALILSALLFGALHKGALDLDLETEHVTRDLSAVIQALILVALAARRKK